MKSLKNIIIVCFMILVSNAAMAQEGTFNYPTKKCKYTQIVPADNNWKKTSKNGYTPTSESALLYQKAEKCSGWYFQPGVFGGYTNLTHDEGGSSSAFSARGELIAGYDFCFGHNAYGEPRNFAISLEAKLQVTNMPKLVYQDLTYIKSGYVPTIGGNVVFQLSKHKACQFAIFGGAGFTRLTSYYPNAGEKSLNKLNHNTFSYEGGVQMLWRTKLGHSVGIKAGYEHVQTTHLGRGQAFIGVVWKMKKVHKSQKMTYADFYRSVHNH